MRSNKVRRAKVTADRNNYCIR